jgi:NTE family protein
VETGEEIVLDSGSLPLAVTASGAIPSFFSPVNIDGKLIIDGGVTDNYPIEKLKAKGMDVIIGVDVQDGLANRNRLGSAFEILTQVNNFRTINAMKTKRRQTDLYIHPNIKAFDVLSFGEGKDIINSGEDAARNKLEALLKLANRQGSKNRKIPAIRMLKKIKINDISIKGNNAYPRNYIRGKLKIPTYATIDYSRLNRGIENLVATGNFKRVEYELHPASNNSYDIQFNILENENNLNLKFALHYDRLYQSSVLVNLTAKSLFFTNDIASVDIIGGNNFRYDLNYYIDKGQYWSIGLNHSLDQFEKDVGFDFVSNNSEFKNSTINQVEIKYLDVTTQLYAETLLFDSFKLGVGLEQDYTEIETNTIFPKDLPENSEEEDIPAVLENSNLYSTFGYVKYDTYDNAYFPRSGLKFTGNFHLYLFDSGSSYDFSQFSIIDGSVGYAFSPLDYLTLRVQSQAGFRVGNTDMSGLNFFLGGYGNNYVNNIHSFLGYEHLGLSGNSYIKSKIQLDFQPFLNNHLKLTYNIANVKDDLFQTTKWLTEVNYSGFGIGYGIETVVGPLELTYSYSPERSQSEWFLSLGFWF